MLEIAPLNSSATQSRITAINNGETRPLFETRPKGPCSPSTSLLIERHDVQPSDWQRIILPEQIITLHLRRSSMEYEDTAGHSSCLIRAKGSVLIERRACEQRFRWNSSASILTVRLSDAVLDQAVETSPSVREELPDDRTIDDMRISSLLLALERERMHRYPAGRLFVDGIEQALAAILVRYYDVGRRSTQVYKGGLAPYRMKRVTEFVHAHLEEVITLEELARDVGLSSSHFCSLFRKTSGKTPHQFVLHCRIQHAKSLLAEPNRSILDVALASGFQNHQHFSRTFHRLVGLPPSVYRAQL